MGLLDIWVEGHSKGETVTTPACSSNLCSDHKERLKLPDVVNQHQELAKPQETKIFFLCKCPLEIKLWGKEQKAGGDVSDFVSGIFPPLSFLGRVSGWLRHMFADQICR